MFSPSVICEASELARLIRVRLVSIPTMTSADFSAHRKLIYSETSPGKNAFLRPMPAVSTI